MRALPISTLHRSPRAMVAAALGVIAFFWTGAIAAQSEPAPSEPTADAATGDAAMPSPGAEEADPNVPVPQLQGEAKQTDNAGSARLSWEAPEEPPLLFQLQVGSDAQFAEARMIDAGHDRSTYLSGLANGSYYFRVRARPESGATWGAWSDTHQVDIEHWSHARAFGLAGLGAVVFLLTLGVVVAGARERTPQAS